MAQAARPSSSRRLLLAATCAAAVAAALHQPAAAGSWQDWFNALDRDDGRSLQRLLDRGFDPNTVSEDGQGALHLALRDGADQTVAVLLRHPATAIDRPNAHGETPLMLAALRGRVEHMRSLLARGAAIARPGWTPLHYAASGPEPAATALLVERGAALDARAPNGSTPLMMAARDGAIDGAVHLLLRGADPTLRNARGQSAAELARAAGRERLAAQLEDAERTAAARRRAPGNAAP